MDSAQALHPPIDGSLVGISSAGTVVINQQPQGLTTNHGDIVLAGGNANIHKHYHTYHAEPKISILSALRLVRNLRKIHLDVLSKATPGTGIWLLKTDKFILWLDLDGNLRILWGTGIPGAGKTVMASIVINEVETRAAAAGGSVCVCYVYFRYSEASDLTVRTVLEILVKQTVERHPECAPLAEATYAQHLNEDTQPTEAELLQLLHLFVRGRSATFYILDALDEAPDKVQLDLIKKLASLNVRLFITSRPLQGVESCVPGVHSLPIAAQIQDLDLHINQEMERSLGLQNLLKKGGLSLRDEIVTSIKEKCNGMFLHASLQLDALCECLTPGEVRRTLEAFPSSIEDVYLQTWSRIVTRNPTRVLLAKTVLLWVINAARPMTIEELERAVATSPKTLKFEPDEVVPGMNLVTLCRGLVTFEEESSVVRLVHYTAKETLQNFLQDSFPHPQSHLATVCMTHLAGSGFQNTAIMSKTDFIAARQADPLLAYASDAWAVHARASLDNEDTRLGITDFVGEARAFPAFTSRNLLEEFDLLSPLHILANYDLPMTLLDSNNIGDPNVRTGIGQESPLMLASKHGHIGAVAFLIARLKILVNLASGKGWSALMLAANNGHEDIVQELLARSDIQVNSVDSEGFSSLMKAAGHGNEGIVNLLLTCSDIQVNVVNDKGWSALMLAASHGHKTIVELFLACSDIQVNSVDSEGFSALMKAAGHGHKAIVNSLLGRTDIQVNLFSSNSGWSAIMLAATNGHADILELLLVRPEVQVNSVDSEGWSALMKAAGHGHERIVSLLLVHSDVAVNLVNDKGWSALLIAAAKGHEGIVKLLLAHSDIQVNLVNDDGWSALMLSAAHGHTGIVEALLAHSDIQVNSVDNEGFSALVKAAGYGHDDIVKRFLARSDIQVNLFSNNSGWSALMLAAGHGHEGIVKLLLARSEILVNSVDNEGWSALMRAAGHGHEGIVRLLLDVPHINTSLKSKGSVYTAMSFALAGGHHVIARLLHEFESRPTRTGFGDSIGFDVDQLFLENDIDEDGRSVEASSWESDVYYDAEEGSESAEPVQPM